MKKKLFVAGALSLALGSSVATGADISERKMSWAHHTPWHTPLNTSLTAVNYYNFPLLDCGGNDLEAWKREFAQAKAQGIDGFLPDVVADKKGGRTAFSDTLRDMLKAAEGSDFEIGACLDVKTTVDQQVRELKRMLDLFAAHPNYPNWKGRPVVNFYTYLGWTPEELAAIRSGVKAAGHDIYIIGNIGFGGYKRYDAEFIRPYFKELDMVYSFGAAELAGLTLAEQAATLAQLAKEENKELMTTVTPGYYGAWLNGRNDFYQVHDGFDHAHRTFEAALTPQAKHLHFTTWNDHDETSFLPMVFTPGNALITKAYSREFKGEIPADAKPEVLFAYHREELPGTLLRFEAMTLPGSAKGEVEISGRLIGLDGKAVAELPKKKLDGVKFDRVEWLVPSAGITPTPFLTPEFFVNGERVRLPEMLLVTGWHQNAVTVKVAASQVIAAESTLEVAERNGVLLVRGNYRSPAELKRVTLWRNDRPIALIAPETERKTLLNLQISGTRDYTITPIRGSVLCGVKKFAANNGAGLRWDAQSFTTKGNLSWTPSALVLGGTPDMELDIRVAGADPLRISAGELTERERLEYNGMKFVVHPVDGTIQNRDSLNRREGSFEFEVFNRTIRKNDRFQLHFETADGRSGWSKVSYPFAGNPAALKVKLVETATNLETPSNATGRKGHNEYLSSDVPFRTPAIREALISPLSIRGGHWDFEGDGRDQLGDMPVDIPETMFVENALRFTGKESVKMRLRTYPVGAATVDFQIKPEGGREKIQGIITREGWSDALNLYLLPDGRLEVVRDGDETFKVEKISSKTPLPDGKWSRARVSCDNTAIRIYLDGKLDSETPVTPGRSYGNCTYYLGRGDKRSANFTGMLDNLTILGEAFAPGDPNEPGFEKTKAFKAPAAPGTPQADPATEQNGSWNIPAKFKQEGSDIFFNRNANSGSAEAEGIALAEGTMITVPFLRFDRQEPKKAWYAFLISVGNDRKQSVNFNFGGDGQMMVTVNEPEWKIKSGHFKFAFPAEFSFAKRDGNLILLLNGRVIYQTPDNPEAPYTRLRFSATSPNREDETIIGIGAPKLYKLR